MHFSHETGDDPTGTSQVFTANSLPGAHAEFGIRIESPKAKSYATFKLPRYRVRALVHALQEWLDATEGWDSKGGKDG